MDRSRFIARMVSHAALALYLAFTSIPCMEKAVSAADANRNFSKLLRTVKEGHSYVVTSHAKAVAKIVPVDANGATTPGASGCAAEEVEIRARSNHRPLELG